MTGIALYNLPQRQREVLHFIIRHIDEKGVSPSLVEISNACSMVVPQVQQILSVLENKGRIKREKNSHRSIVVLR